MSHTSNSMDDSQKVLITVRRIEARLMAICSSLSDQTEIAERKLEVLETLAARSSHNPTRMSLPGIFLRQMGESVPWEDEGLEEAFSVGRYEQGSDGVNTL